MYNTLCMEGQQPGQTISPAPVNEAPAVTTQPEAATTIPQPPVATTPPQQNIAPAPIVGESFSINTPDTPDEIAESSSDPLQKAKSTQNEVQWTASEFIAHEKNASWYITLGVGFVIFAALIYILTKDKISTVVILLVGLVFGYFATRKPRVLIYRLDPSGLTIDKKFYGFERFKSFSIIDEGAIPSIFLMPMQRFMLPLSLYYAPDHEDQIADFLANYLPIEDRQPDVIERTMRRIRF